jgi:hypothetical protein
VISEVETILDVPEWKFNYTHKDAATGAETPVLAAHMFSGANAFRLHGFEMRFPPSAGQMVRRIAMSHTRDVVLEHCYIRASESFEGEPVDIGDWNAGDGVGMKAWMRECIIEGSVTFTAHYKGPDIPERRSSLVVERNYFLGVGTEHHLMISGPAMKNLAIRHNVFAGNATRDILMGQVVAPTSLEVSNNSLLSQNGITFSGGIPQASVTIRNNLHSRFGIVSIVGDDGAALRAAAQHWNIDHNAYPDLTGGNAVSSVLPPQPADIAILPRYLSKVPQEADYLRIAADDQLATAGAGGQWPTYLGALPPGPAPADGDWFTRIRERWITSDKSK